MSDERETLARIIAHTGYLPSADRELLAGLLASIQRIANERLKALDSEGGNR